MSLDAAEFRVESSHVRAELKQLIKADLAAEQAALENSTTAENTNSPQKKNFRFRHINDIIDNIQPTDWLIEVILEAGGMSVLYGDPVSYKSFLALDWALSIATGLAWNDHPVKSGPVFLFIGEGAAGYARRISAWQKATGRYVRDIPVYVSEGPVQMLDRQSTEAAAVSIKELQEIHGQPKLVAFDTLARNFGAGDENSTADMTRFVSTLDEFIGNDIARLLVHHSGHGDKTRGRVSSALKGAADAEYQLERKGAGVTLHCRKMKGAVEFPQMHFEPEIVTVAGTFEDPVTSLYLVPADKPVQREEKLSPQMPYTHRSSQRG